MINRVQTFDHRYRTLDLKLDDQRLDKFIRAMAEHKRVSFESTVYVIQHIHLTPVKAILVLIAVDL